MVQIQIGGSFLLTLLIGSVAAHMAHQKSSKLQFFNFLTAVKKAIESGEGIGSLELNEPELRYLAPNAVRLPGLGDAHRFLRLTELMDGADPAVEIGEELRQPHPVPDGELIQQIADYVAELAETAQSPASDNEAESRREQAGQQLEQLGRALGYAQRSGNREQTELLESLLSAVPADSHYRPDPLRLTDAFTYHDTELFRHMVTTHPDAARYREELFNPGENEAYTQLLESGGAEEGRILMSILPEEDIQGMVTWADLMLWKPPGGHFARGVMESYPVTAIGNNRHQDQCVLFLALEHGRDDLVNALLEHHKDDVCALLDRDHFSPITSMITGSRPEMVKHLIDTLLESEADQWPLDALNDIVFRTHMLAGENDLFEYLLNKLEEHDLINEQNKQLKALYIDHDTPTVALTHAYFGSYFMGKTPDTHKLRYELEKAYGAGRPDIATVYEEAYPEAFEAVWQEYQKDPKCFGPKGYVNLLEAFPERALELIASNDYAAVTEYLESLPADVALLVAALPEEHRQIVMDRLPSHLQHSVTQYQHGEIDENGIKARYGSWKAAFADDPAFVKNLSPLVKEQSPYGFNREVYDALLPLLETGEMIEGTFDVAPLNAYKLSVLFDNPRKACKFLDAHAPRESAQSIHDLMLFELPSEPAWDIEAWSNRMMAHGPTACRLLPLVPAIEKALYRQASEEAGIPFDRWTASRKQQNKVRDSIRNLDMDTMLEIAAAYAYEHSDKDPELARFCISVGAEEARFDETLRILEPFRPRPDENGRIDEAAIEAAAERSKKNIPEIHIDGAEIGVPGYRLDTVEASHPWNLWIGMLVNCCNYLGGATGHMAVAQTESPDARLLVITDRKGDPVAKMTTWISEDDNIVFNSWERLGAEYDRLCEPFALKAGLMLLQSEECQNADRVTLGTNRGNANFRRINDPETPKSPELGSADANEQYEVVTRERMKLAEIRLEEWTRKEMSEEQEKTPGTRFQFPKESSTSSRAA